MENDPARKADIKRAERDLEKSRYYVETAEEAWSHTAAVKRP